MFHITDWLPTILSIVGESEESINHTISSKNLDGMNLWNALKHDTTSPRKSILHNIDDIYQIAGITMNDWKLIQGTTYSGAWDGWYESSESNWTYVEKDVIHSIAGEALTSIGASLTPKIIRNLRSKVTLNCDYLKLDIPCNPLKEACLFNVHLDPCEFNNVAEQNPEVMAMLHRELEKWNETAIPPSNLPWDPRGNPELWDHTWNNFGDYELPTVTTTR